MQLLLLLECLFVMLLCKIDRDRMSSPILSFVNHTLVIIEFEFT